VARRAANLLFSAHARAEAARQLQGFILIQIEIVTKRAKNRRCDKFGNCPFTSVHNSFSPFLNQKEPRRKPDTIIVLNIFLRLSIKNIKPSFYFFIISTQSEIQTPLSLPGSLTGVCRLTGPSSFPIT
jgi:hypothetical protein